MSTINSETGKWVLAVNGERRNHKIITLENERANA
jgi:hypothetical protein